MDKHDCFCGFKCSADEKADYEHTWPGHGDFARAVRKLLNDEVARLASLKPPAYLMRPHGSQAMLEP